MDDYVECTNAPGYIYGALDKVFEHAMAAIRLVYDVRSSERVRRVDCSDLCRNLLNAMNELEKAKQYADQIELVQNAVEEISDALDYESREEMEAAKAKRAVDGLDAEQETDKEE